MGFLRPPKAIGTTQQHLGGIRFQVSLYGKPRPIVYGHNRLSPNMIWYGDFKIQNAPQPSSGGKGGLGTSGGKGQTQQQTVYFASIVLALCEGPIVGIGNIWDSSGQLSLNQASENFTVPAAGGSFTVVHAATYQSDQGVFRQDSFSQVVNDPGSQGPITVTGTQLTPMLPVSGVPSAGQYLRNGGTYTFAIGDAGKVMTIIYNYAIQTADTSGIPVQQLNLTQFLGTRPQTPWSYLTTNHPGQDLNYAGLAYVASANAPLGTSGMVPNLSFEVYGFLSGYGFLAQDVNPRDFIIDFLTNPFYGVADGVNFSHGWLPSDIGDLTTYANYCIANGLFISPIIEEARPASDYIKDVLEATNSEAVMSSGKLKIVPYGETTTIGNGVVYVPPTQPIYDLNDDDFIQAGTDKDPIMVTRPTPQDAYNCIQIEYNDRGANYNPAIVEAVDQDAVERYSRRPEGTRSYHFFTMQAAASAAAQTILSRSVNVRNTYDITLTARYILLEPMDVCTFTDPALGFFKKPLRLKTIDEQQDGTFKTMWEEMPFSTSSPTLYPKQPVSSTPSGAQAQPGPVNTPIMFEAISRLNDQIGHEIVMGLSGGPNWGGCSVWVSRDNTNFKLAAQFAGKSRMGLLTGTFPSHSDPDTTNTLSVDLAQSGGALASGTAADCDNFATLCWVDGELISYQTATLVSGNAYNIGTRIRRGVGGTTIGSHATNSKFLRIDDAVFEYIYDPMMTGQTLFFKFTSWNLFRNNEEPLSAVTSYSIAVTGSGPGLLTPAHISYRPLSNPLTGHDAGASVTVNIAAFTMRIPGVTDLPINSGSISGLSYLTVYYIYYDDIQFIGQTNGPVTFVATTTKEIAINAAGRFFIGSILTPKAGAPDTIGNNDGGAGAQIGTFFIFGFTLTQATAGTIGNPTNAIDGDMTSFAQMVAVAINGGVNSATNTLVVSAGTPTSAKWQSLTLKVRSQVQAYSGNSTANSPTSIAYSLDGGASFTNIFSLNQNNGATAGRALQTDSVSLPLKQNLGLIKVQCSNTANAPNPGDSVSTELDVYEVWIEALQ